MKARRAISLGGAAALTVAAFFAGRALKPGAESASAFDLTAPAYTTSSTVAGFSKGGFSGFGEVAGMDGHTVIAGHVVSVGADALEVESSAGVRSSVSLTGNGPLKRFDAAGRETLRPGVTVVVRKQADGSAAAVLIVAEP